MLREIVYLEKSREERSNWLLTSVCVRVNFVTMWIKSGLVIKCEDKQTIIQINFWVCLSSSERDYYLTKTLLDCILYVYYI